MPVEAQAMSTSMVTGFSCGHLENSESSLFRRLLVTPPLVVLCSSSPCNWSLSTAPHRFSASCFSSVSTHSHRQKLSAHVFCTTRHIIFSESAKTRSFLLRLGEAFIHRCL